MLRAWVDQVTVTVTHSSCRYTYIRGAMADSYDVIPSTTQAQRFATGILNELTAKFESSRAESSSDSTKKLARLHGNGIASD